MKDSPESLEGLLARDLDAWRAAKEAIEKAQRSSRDIAQKKRGREAP